MATLQEKIKNRLLSLAEIDKVKVEVSDSLGQIHIRHGRKKSANFKFKWVDGNHYVGYFVDSDDNESQAIVSIFSFHKLSKTPCRTIHQGCHGQSSFLCQRFLALAICVRSRGKRLRQKTLIP